MAIIVKNNFYNYFHICNICVLFALNGAVQAGQLSSNDCPTKEAIQHKQFDRAINIHDDYTWAGIKYSQYNTKINWIFVLDLSGKRYENEKEAIKYANETIQFFPPSDPQMVNNICQYPGIFSKVPRAVAVPISAPITNE